ncbi:hypothetical protein J6590_002791 [Homalodisca vitripennis]|nr:hypothetical protein J6590_002791 [Homalodisca vitripennis]
MSNGILEHESGMSNQFLEYVSKFNERSLEGAACEVAGHTSHYKHACPAVDGWFESHVRERFLALLRLDSILRFKMSVWRILVEYASDLGAYYREYSQRGTVIARSNHDEFVGLHVKQGFTIAGYRENRDRTSHQTEDGHRYPGPFRPGRY